MFQSSSDVRDTPAISVPKQGSFSAQSGHGKELVMHCLMYGVSLYGELSELRAQYQNNAALIKFYSQALT